MKLTRNELEEYRIQLDLAGLNGFTDVQLPLNIAKLLFEALEVTYDLGMLQTEEIQ